MLTKSCYRHALRASNNTTSLDNNFEENIIFPRYVMRLCGILVQLNPKSYETVQWHYYFNR